jgi:hypothetical protein
MDFNIINDQNSFSVMNSQIITLNNILNEPVENINFELEEDFFTIYNYYQLYTLTYEDDNLNEIIKFIFNMCVNSCRWEIVKSYKTILAFYNIQLPELIPQVKTALKSITTMLHRQNILRYIYTQLINNGGQNMEPIKITLDEEDIKKLNPIKYCDVDKSLCERNILCTICRETFNDDSDVILLPCDGKHIFCSECIINWLKNYHYSCPTCKESVGKHYAHIEAQNNNDNEINNMNQNSINNNIQNDDDDDEEENIQNEINNINQYMHNEMNLIFMLSNNINLFDGLLSNNIGIQIINHLNNDLNENNGNNINNENNQEDEQDENSNM